MKYSKDNETKRNKALIDDGMNPELVKDVEFDGFLGIPKIKRPDEFIIPNGITPFNCRSKVVDKTEAIGFYIMDTEFADLLAHPEKYVEEFKDKVVITPDCSLYRDAPLAVQITNVYKNRALGAFYQNNGAYVIPQIRWGNRLTYTTDVLPEKVAFLGVEKHSIVAIGTYGCIQGQENKKYFKEGLKEMLLELEPEIVLVYGPMPKSVFEDFISMTKFVQFDDWITRKKTGR